MLSAGTYTLQAYLGSYLIQKLMGHGIPRLINPKGIFAFLGLAGPVHTLFAATIFTIAYFYYEVGSWKSVWQLFVAWWWCDAIAGMVFTPVTLTLIGTPREVWAQRRWSVGLPLLLTTILVGALFVWAREADQRKSISVLQHETDQAAAVLRSDINRASSGLKSMVEGRWLDAMALQPGERLSLRAELTLLRQTSPLIRNTSIALHVPDEKLNQVHAELNLALQFENLAPSQLRQLSDEGPVELERNRDHYMPLVLVDPIELTDRIIGCDIFTHSHRREAIIRAVETGEPAGTGMVGTIHSDFSKQGMLVYVSFYSRGVLPETVEERRNEFKGTIIGMFDPEVIDDILSVGRDKRIQWKIEPFADEENQVRIDWKNNQYSVFQQFDFAGKEFQLVAIAPNEYLLEHYGNLAPMIAAAGLGLTALLAGLLLGVSGRTLAISEQVQRHLKALQDESRDRHVTETALRSSERQLHEAKEIARLAYWEFDPTGEMFLLSNKACDLLRIDRLTSYDISINNFLEYIHPEDRQSIQKLAEIDTDAEPYSFEFRLNSELLQGAENRYFYARFRIADLEDALALMPGILQDITEQKKNEYSLLESERRFRSLADSAPVGIWISDPNGACEYMGPQIVKYCGGRDSDFLDFQWGNFLHQEDQDKILAAVQDAKQKRTGYNLDIRIRAADGSYGWFLNTAAMRTGPRGECVGFVGTLVDITDRVNTEERLRSSEARLADAQWLAKLGYWDWYPEENRAFWSDQKFQLLGIDKNVTRPSYEMFLARVHPDDRDYVIKQINDALDQGELPGIEFRVVMPDGETRYLYEHARVHLDDKGRVNCMSGVTQDITERKLAELERKELEQRFQDSQRIECLGMLAGGIAHDFNNLLTGVLGNASLAKELLGEDSPVIEYLAHIESSAKHASQLCQKLLAYAGHGEINHHPIDINYIVNDAFDLLRMSLPRVVELDCELATEVPFALGDEANIRQILLNLIQNAAEAMHGRVGKVVIRTGTDADPDMPNSVWSGNSLEAPYVWIEVEDTASGMSKETARRIFEPFYTTKFTGRGLGLSSVHGIVKQHSGVIAVQSAEGVGTTFRVYFPAIQYSGDSTLSKLNGTATSKPSGKHPKIGTILVVDGDRYTRELACNVARAQNLNVVTAETGLELLDAIQVVEGKLLLALVEYEMVGIDGRNAYVGLCEVFPDLTVVLMVKDQDVAPTLASELNQPLVLVKPLEVTDLVTLIRNMLSNQQPSEK